MAVCCCCYYYKTNTHTQSICSDFVGKCHYNVLLFIIIIIGGYFIYSSRATLSYFRKENRIYTMVLDFIWRIQKFMYYTGVCTGMH